MPGLKPTDLSIQSVIQLTQPHPTLFKLQNPKRHTSTLVPIRTDDKPLLMINHFGRRFVFKKTICTLSLTDRFLSMFSENYLAVKKKCI